jgi:hypothetical protein
MLRCQRAGPGELRHVDTKKRGRIDGIGHRISGNRRDTRRGAGWEILHVAIDNAARLAYSEILPDERKVSAIAFATRLPGSAATASPSSASLPTTARSTGRTTSAAPAPPPSYARSAPDPTRRAPTAVHRNEPST